MPFTFYDQLLLLFKLIIYRRQDLAAGLVGPESFSKTSGLSRAQWKKSSAQKYYDNDGIEGRAYPLEGKALTPS